jgi:GH24 family phage-related lysozyme (muramidase)
MPYSIRLKMDTYLKTSTAQSSELGEGDKVLVKAGAEYPIVAYNAARNHLQVTFGKTATGEQVFFQGKNTWYLYQPSVDVVRDGQVVSQGAATPEPTAQTAQSPQGMHINDRGLAIVKAFEGLELSAYQDSVGVWTIGYGTTSDIVPVRPGMVITEAQAETYLRQGLTRFEESVSQLITAPLTSDQFSALVVFTYNVGPGSLSESTLRRKLNDQDYAGAADQFLRWNKAGGEELPGLTRRRKAERALFLSQDYSAFLAG